MGNQRKPGERPPIDWDLIAREYRAGQLSVQEIVRQYKVPLSALTKRAKSEGWVRDLGATIEKEAARRVWKQTAKTKAAFTDEATELEIVDAGAERVAKMVEVHVDRAVRMRATADRILDLADEWLALPSKSKAEATVDEIEKNLPRIFVSSGDGMSSIVKAVADLYTKSMEMERKALNIGGEDGRRDKAIVYQFEY